MGAGAGVGEGAGEVAEAGGGGDDIVAGGFVGARAASVLEDEGGEARQDDQHGKAPWKPGLKSGNPGRGGSCSLGRM